MDGSPYRFNGSFCPGGYEVPHIGKCVFRRPSLGSDQNKACDLNDIASKRCCFEASRRENGPENRIGGSSRTISNLKEHEAPQRLQNSMVRRRPIHISFWEGVSLRDSAANKFFSACRPQACVTAPFFRAGIFMTKRPCGPRAAPERKRIKHSLIPVPAVI